MHLFTTREKCHHTTSWNAELIDLSKIILFPKSEWKQLLLMRINELDKQIDKQYYRNSYKIDTTV